jgi:superkiller protein 3
MEIALNHQKIDLAISVMENAVEHSPDEPLAYYNLISVYDKSKMFEKAEEARKRLKERFAKKAKDSPGA